VETARRRRTIAGSVRSELLGPVPRRRRWRARRRRRKFGRGWRRRFGRRGRDIFRDRRRGRFYRLRRPLGNRPVRLPRAAPATAHASPMVAPDHRGRCGRVGDLARGRFPARPPLAFRRRARFVLPPRRRLRDRFVPPRRRLGHRPYRLDRRGPRPRQPDVPAQRRRLRRAHESRHDPQGDQADDDDRRRPRHTSPPDPHARHPLSRDRRGETLPPQSSVARALAMSASWSSTQSPGLREKMMSRRPCAHSAFCSGAIVRAR
jgi:hypothetical protein